MRTLPLLLLPLSGCFGLQSNISVDTGYWGDSAESETNGTPVSEDLTGKVYAVGPTDMTLVEPAQLAELYLENVGKDILIYVASETTTTLQLQAALAADDGSQNPCETVRDLPQADWLNPSFQAGPADMEIGFGGQPATLQDVELTGTFSPDAGSFGDGTLAGVVDARELAAALGGIDACEMLDGMGSSCIPCDDGELQCASVRFEDVQGTEASMSFDPTPTCP